MKTERFNGLMSLFSILGIVGLIFICFSDNFGISIADGWLAKYDYVDSSLYEFKIKANTIKFVVTGGILFSINLIAIFLVYYKMLNSRE
ncbi:hypothetical protein [Ornithinibacillus bavariensis]|uniref:Uncharacterized protein n=1 Tax=Ornithinibacillus bavariensis TaxID=545502 RepID=A0A920C692_9BACI|nr:hypothetical protein [Ornithinibacillus bavariensis]GIO26353.1 hypothetical protein J43TS3_09640 [Ornithinibacillus bavariensis]